MTHLHSDLAFTLFTVFINCSYPNAKLIYQKYTEENDCLGGKTWPVYFWLDRATCSVFHCRISIYFNSVALLPKLKAQLILAVLVPY